MAVPAEGGPMEESRGPDGGVAAVDASSSGPGLLGLADGSAVSARACMQDSDCDTQDPCMLFACPPTMGELFVRTCVYTPALDAGLCGDARTADAQDAGETNADDAGQIDSSSFEPGCTDRDASQASYPPYVPLAPPDVPANCTSGFEIGDATRGSAYAIYATSTAGAADIVLDVDFATYLQPDRLVVTGTDASGATRTLLDTCRIQTSDKGDPTGGVARPPDQTIRQFRAHVIQGTIMLTFDFAGVVSPMYVQVRGLCDFYVAPFITATWWQAVP